MKLHRALEKRIKALHIEDCRIIKYHGASFFINNSTDHGEVKEAWSDQAQGTALHHGSRP